jgi:hypothetical protein
VFAGNLDLPDDPDIQRIRDSARERMSSLLLGLVGEGQEQGQIVGGLSEEAFRVYFGAFMDVFVDPQLQHRLRRDPRLVHDLSSLMLYGLSGRRAS